MEKTNKQKFSKKILHIQRIETKIASVTQKLKEDVLMVLKRKGAVVGISGGIDSSVTLALTAKAIGPENVIGILLPEKDSSNESKELALKLADQLGVKNIEENITAALEGFGCYRRRDEAVKAIFPEYDPQEYAMKIGISPEGTFRADPDFHC